MALHSSTEQNSATTRLNRFLSALFFRQIVLALTFTIVSPCQIFAQQADPFSVVADDAAWCWFSDPRAVYHKGAHEKIYFGYINSKGDVVIAARDLKTQAVDHFVLHASLQIDDHNVPSILILPDGRILAFYTEHNGRFFMRKSTYPENIGEWEEEQTIAFGLHDKRLCYSHPVMLTEEQNRIYMFFRGITPGKSYKDWGHYYAYSDDLGKSWTDAKYYLDTKEIDNAPYVKITSDSKSRIDILFTDGHPKIGAASVYHVYYTKGQFHQTDGEHLASQETLPLQLPAIKKLYDAGVHQTKAWIWDIALDKRSRPVVTYAKYPSVKDHVYHYAFWDGKKWRDQQLIHSGGYITTPETSGKVLEEHYSGGVVLDHQNPKNVFLSRRVDGVFEIEHWRLASKRWKKTVLTRNSGEHNVRPYVVSASRNGKPVLMWMRGNYGHYTRYETSLVMRAPQKD